MMMIGENICVMLVKIVLLALALATCQFHGAAAFVLSTSTTSRAAFEPTRTFQQRQLLRHRQRCDTSRVILAEARRLQTNVDPTFAPVQLSHDAATALLQEKGAQLLELSIFPHRPLGCTVEESLAALEESVSSSSSSAHNYVFVSKIVPGGNAEQAGLQTGDVLVGLSGLFDGEIMDVTHVGVEKIKGLVGCRNEDEPLVVRVVRGTSISDRHEEALVELCSNPGSSDSEVEQCLLDFLQAGYYDENSGPINGFTAAKEVEAPSLSIEEDADGLVDNLCNMWANDIPGTSSAAAVAAAAAAVHPNERGNAPEPKVKPWSSRSSPSGTWVRDPATGKMRNLDA